MELVKRFIWQIIFYIVSMVGPHKIRFSKNNLLILTYHRVLPENDRRIEYEQPGMYVTTKTFELHLKLLQKYFTIMPLNKWLEKAKATKKLPKRACAITFDDGWQDNYEYAYPLLKKYKVPATIFTVSNFIGSEKDFWPGRLAQLIDFIAKNEVKITEKILSWLNKSIFDNFVSGEKLTPNQLDEVIKYCKQYSDAENHQYIDDAWKQLAFIDSDFNEKPYRATLNQEELEEMISSDLIDIGSHTCNHIRLRENLSEDVLELEIEDSKNILKEKFKRPVELFCYPNGDYTKATIKKVVEKYKGACTTQRGWNSSNSHFHLLKRISIHDSMTKTANGFLTKISGWI